MLCDSSLVACSDDVSADEICLYKVLQHQIEDELESGDVLVIKTTPKSYLLVCTVKFDWRKIDSSVVERWNYTDREVI